MLKIAALLLSALSLVACVDTASPSDLEAQTPRAELATPTGGKADAHDTDATCHVLPTSDACAAACDEEALQEHIPAGTCVLFRCQLDDGSDVGIGGCRPPE